MASQGRPGIRCCKGTLINVNTQERVVNIIGEGAHAEHLEVTTDVIYVSIGGKSIDKICFITVVKI